MALVDDQLRTKHLRLVCVNTVDKTIIFWACRRCTDVWMHRCVLTVEFYGAIDLSTCSDGSTGASDRLELESLSFAFYLQYTLI